MVDLVIVGRRRDRGGIVRVCGIIRCSVEVVVVDAVVGPGANM